MTYSSAGVKAWAEKRDMKIDTYGDGRPPLLILHGGGGPITLLEFAKKASGRFNVILPTHPGFDGTARPREIATIEDLARIYAGLIADTGLSDVLVMGFSLGGWLASELIASFPEGIAGLFLVDAVGMKVEGQEVLHVNNMAPAQIADHSYHRPEKFRIDPNALSPAAKAMMQANFDTLAVYADAHYMQDPGLEAKLATIRVPSLVVWGESDGIVRPAYGRAFADAIPCAQFEQIAQCGHLPQLEQPVKLRAMLSRFAERVLEC